MSPLPTVFLLFQNFELCLVAICLTVGNVIDILIKVLMLLILASVMIGSSFGRPQGFFGGPRRFIGVQRAPFQGGGFGQRPFQGGGFGQRPFQGGSKLIYQ